LTVNKRTRDLQEAQFQVVHQEKMASIGLLAAGIAHEIGNPLTSISSMVQLMKRKIDDPKLISYLTTIHQNIERISKIVRELVDFSRPSRSELVLTNVTKTIEAAVGIIKYDKRARDIDFFLKLDEDIPEILIVEDQLMQVFVNILVNAVDAIKEEPKRIEVRTNFNDEFIFIEFKDSGVGISKSMQKRIFEPFFTTKEVGKGTGLGLSVSYGIVQNFGGTITVESTPGVSTIFTIILPITEENGKVPELLRKKLDE
jgi:signal transduction histidine kinase